MSLKPYQPLIPHGKFNSKLVPGRNGKMRIHETDNRPIEGMISKIYPAKEAEEILSIRSEGVQDFDADGNPQYIWGMVAGGLAAAGAAYGMYKGAKKRGHSGLNFSKWSLGDIHGSQTVAKTMGWGKYYAEEKKKETLDKMMPGQMEDIMGQSEAMLEDGGYFDQQLGQEMAGFDLQGEQIAASGVQARNQFTNQANQVATQFGGSGIASSGAQQQTQQQLLTQAYGAGQQRQFGHDTIELGRQKALTADDLKRVKYEGDTQSALASMITSYMSATGEDVPDEMMDLWTEYTGG